MKIKDNDKAFVLVMLSIIIFTLYLLFIWRVPACTSITPDDWDKLNEDKPLVSRVEEARADELRMEHQDGNEIIMLFQGLSMYPNIGEHAICKCVATEDYEVGDIVAFLVRTENDHFKMNGKDYLLVGHRIIEKHNESFIITQGDGNIVADPPIEERDILCEIPQMPTLDFLFWKLNG